MNERWWAWELEKSGTAFKDNLKLLWQSRDYHQTLACLGSQRTYWPWRDLLLKQYKGTTSSSNSKGKVRLQISSSFVRNLASAGLVLLTLCLSSLRCGLRTVINLQRPGEHAECGNPLEPESGFSYRPEAFMEAGSEWLHTVMPDRHKWKESIHMLRWRTP